MSTPTTGVRADIQALQDRMDHVVLQDRADAVHKLYAQSHKVLGDLHPATLAMVPEVRATRYEAEAAQGAMQCRSTLGPNCVICTADRRKAAEARAAATPA
jgi:hypothetical protein